MGKPLNIVIEINGVRHKLFRGKRPKDGTFVCDKCSIKKLCRKCIGICCVGIYSYFKKEE